MDRRARHDRVGNHLVESVTGRASSDRPGKGWWWRSRFRSSRWPRSLRRARSEAGGDSALETGGGGHRPSLRALTACCIPGSGCSKLVRARCSSRSVSPSTPTAKRRSRKTRSSESWRPTWRANLVVREAEHHASGGALLGAHREDGDDPAGRCRVAPRRDAGRGSHRVRAPAAIFARALT